jgi:integrase
MSVFRSLTRDDFGGDQQPPPPPALAADDFGAVAALPASSSETQRLRRPTFEAKVDDSPRFSLATPTIVLDLPHSGSSSSQAERDRLAVISQECIRDSWAPGTYKAYETTLRLNVGDAEFAVEAELLPMDSESKFMTAFARLDGQPWATVRLLKSAVRAWHISAQCLAAFEASWTDNTLRFWQGLKRRAAHGTKPKQPVSEAELDSFCTARLAHGTPAGLRDAATAAMDFYGVRRCSEHIALLRSDVSFRPGPPGERHVELFISKQKNDPCGKGMTCVVPERASKGHLCPHLLLRRWAAVWDSMYGSGDPKRPFFCVSNKDEPKHTSYDSWRKTVAKHFENQDLGTHSFRKGGAHWYRQVAGVPDEAIQEQGGWASAATMKAVYSGLTSSERRSALLAGTRTAGDASSRSSATAAPAPRPPRPPLQEVGVPPPKTRKRAAPSLTAPGAALGGQDLSTSDAAILRQAALRAANEEPELR